MKKILLITIALLWPSISFGAIITFGNYNSITINDSGAASPYPSIIEVSGLSDVILTDVNVTLLGLSHTASGDINIALVGPTGESVVLMANVNDGGKFGVENAFLTFDNEASSSLPEYSSIISGIYKVSQYSSSYANAIPTPLNYFTFGTDLSIFDGTDPNGTWSLYVFDDFSEDSGSIAYGWTLSLETAQVPIPGAALLLGSGLLGLVAFARKRV